MKALEDAIIMACKAHGGQKDKANMPYILHPLRVMLKMETLEEMMVAILHDVVEDTDVTINDLKAMDFPEDVINAVDLLTHKEEDDYFDYVRSCRIDPIARRVKEADANDNMDLTRIDEPNKKDFSRKEKYSSVVQLMRQNKDFYNSKQYKNMSRQLRLLTEDLFKRVESEGIRYIVEFIEDGYVLKIVESPEQNILVVRFAEDYLKITITGAKEAYFDYSQNTIVNNKFMGLFKKTISERHEYLHQLLK